MQSTGKLIIIIGLFITLVGVIVYFVGNRFNWFGNLPGDVKVEKENFRFYAPIMSMIVISMVISLFFWLINKFR